LSVASGGDLQITSFGGNGELVFNEITNAISYRVEWAPAAGGPWYSFEGSGLLNGIVAAGTGSVTSSVPMFYRVAAVTNAPPPGSRNMVPIPGGTNSGTNPLAEGESYREWYPATYSLTVDTFYMDKYEVTNDEMVRVMQWAYDNGNISASSIGVTNLMNDQQELLDLDATECRITWDGASFGMKSTKGSGYPCVEVSWYGSVAYCNYRSEMDERTPCYNLSDWSCNFSANGYRLPTKDEWEYAARGGLSGKRFPWGDTVNHNNANYRANGSVYSYDTSPYTIYTFHPDYDEGGEPYTSPVGDFAANGYGLHDMAGNVWEWCNGASVFGRYISGGGWAGYAEGLRCGLEGDGDPDYSHAPPRFSLCLPLSATCAPPAGGAVSNQKRAERAVFWDKTNLLVSPFVLLEVKQQPCTSAAESQEYTPQGVCHRVPPDKWVDKACRWGR